MKLLKEPRVDDPDKKTKLSAREVWSNVIRRKLDKNMSKEGPRRDYNFYASTNTLYSGTDRVLYMYTIDGLPATINMNYKKMIREACKEDVRVSFIDMYEPTTIPWDSARMKSRLSTWREQSKKAREKDDGSAFSELTNLDDLNRAKYREVSVSYFSSAERTRGRKIFIKRSMMYISGYRGDIFDESVDSILEVCKNLNLRINRVETDIEMFLKSFSPFSAMVTPETKKQMGTITLTDEIAGMFFDYDHGKVGQGTFYMGTDIHSRRAILKYFKESAVSAENIFVTAKTGDGKSFAIKNMYIQFAAADEYRTTVMDIEGEEYTPIANYLSHTQKVRRINMAVGSGSYFDTVEIPYDKSIKFNDGDTNLVDLYTTSLETTASYFRVLLGIQKVDVKDVKGSVASDAEKVLNIFIMDGVMSAYRRRQVFQSEPNSWVRSRGMTLKDIYEEFKRLDVESRRPVAESDSRLLLALKENDLYKTQFAILMTTLSAYFEPDGLKAGKFKHRITLKDVIDARHVICSFGLEGKSPNTLDPVDMALAQISAAHICHLRSMNCKATSKYHVKVFEELNRWGTIPGSYDTLNTSITGGRKTGDVTIMATNKLKEVLDEDVFGIFENFTSYMIGSVNSSETIDRLCARMRLDSMKSELYQIMKSSSSASDSNNSNTLASRKEEIARAQDLAEHKGSGVSTTNPYNKAFLMGFDGKDPTVGRIELPPEIVDSKLFLTGNTGRKGTADE